MFPVQDSTDTPVLRGSKFPVQGSRFAGYFSLAAVLSLRLAIQNSLVIGHSAFILLLVT
jgi:hypothetical protein